jgi:TolB-like protein/Tfp pilus assembly protein PilF
MAIWTTEIKELEKLYESLKSQLPGLEKELEQLIKTEDPNVIMLYSRRCLEVIITNLCECELKRPRKTEPLKGIIDKLYKEEKVPSHIITSMHGLNELSTYGTHPKDFDPEQVKPVLINLDIIIKWYLKYKDVGKDTKAKPAEEVRQDSKVIEDAKKSITTQKKRLISLVSGLILFIAIIIAVLFFTNIIGSGKQTKEIEKSIAVLPFKLLSEEPDKQYLADGMMDAILLHLSKIKALRVISRTSVEQYRGTSKTIPVIGKELDTEYILEGSFQKSGENVKLIVQLIKAKKENHLWANEYNRNWNDIFSVQSEVAQKIASELNAVITPLEKQLIEKLPTQDLTAYDAYLKGYYFIFGLNLNPINADSAMKYFELAKEIDPGYALAYAGISYVWQNRIAWGTASIAEGSIKSVESIKKALELDSTSAEVQHTLGSVLFSTLWDWEKCELAYKKAIELNPNLAESHAFYSLLLSTMGRNEEALKHGKIALKLDPNNPLIINVYALDLFYAHQYYDAIKTIDEVFKVDSAYFPTLWIRPYVFHMAGRYKEALEAFKVFYVNNYLKEYNHAFDKGFSTGGYAGALRMEADTLLTQANLIKTQHFLPSDLAILYILGGNKEKGLTLLEMAFRERDPVMPNLLMPVFDSVRDEPRFQEIARKMNLPYK